MCRFDIRMGNSPTNCEETRPVMRYIFAVFALLLSFTIASFDAQAQMAPSPVAPPVATQKVVQPVSRSLLRPDTTPVEVLFLYDKMMRIKPFFEAMVYSSPAYRANPEAFAEYKTRKSIADALRGLYEHTGPETVVYQHPIVGIEDFDAQMRGITLTGIDPDQSFNFYASAVDPLAIFARNAREAAMMAPPYVHEDFQAIAMLSDIDRQALTAEVTLKPLSVDVNNVKNDKWRTRTKVIVADVVEIKLFDPSGTRILLHKLFKGWTPPAVIKSGKIPGVAPGAMPAPPVAPSPATTKTE